MCGHKIFFKKMKENCLKIQCCSQQGSASAIKGDFLLSSDHLIEMITKLHRISSMAADREKLNIDILDEYAESLAYIVASGLPLPSW